MANSCLVTKLKAVVDNDSLVEMGNIRVQTYIDPTPYKWTRSFRINTSSSSTLKVMSGDVRLIPNGYNEVPSNWDSDERATTEVIVPSNPTHGEGACVTTNKIGIIEITNKYDISRWAISGVYVNLNDLYLPNCAFLTLSNCITSGNFASLLQSTPSVMNEVTLSSEFSVSNDPYLLRFIKEKDVVSFSVACSGDYSLSDILMNKNSMTTLNMRYSTASGNISELLDNNSLKYPNLTNLNIRDTPNLTKPAEVITQLESLGVTITRDM